MQCSNNCATHEDEETQTVLEALADIKHTANLSTTCTQEVHPSDQHFIMMNQQEREHDAMADGCANSHIGNLNDWLPLTPLVGPLVKHANVTGFDTEHARKNNLPIGVGATKTLDQNQQPVLLRATHITFNESSTMTLLSNCQMRESGLIVDDVTKRHLKDPNQHGTHQLHCVKTGTTIPFTTKAGLPTFKMSKPTMNEHLNWPEDRIMDISIENWNPQDHHEDSLSSTPPLETTMAKMSWNEDNNMTAMMAFHDIDVDPCNTFFNLSSLMLRKKKRRNSLMPMPPMMTTT